MIDAIDAMIALMDAENEVFNLGSGQDFTINEFARLVCEIYDYDYELVEHDLSKYIGVLEKKIDTSKVLSYIKKKIYLKTSLQEGLRTSIDYFVNARGRLK